MLWISLWMNQSLGTADISFTVNMALRIYDFVIINQIFQRLAGLPLRFLGHVAVLLSHFKQSGQLCINDPIVKTVRRRGTRSTACFSRSADTLVTPEQRQHHAHPGG